MKAADASSIGPLMTDPSDKSSLLARSMLSRAASEAFTQMRASVSPTCPIIGARSRYGSCRARAKPLDPKNRRSPHTSHSRRNMPRIIGVKPAPRQRNREPGWQQDKN
jgi:hypothetical protein